MAGQGWREWVAGEQLTDEKMQQFLQDQAVMRFDNASARTTALNGVVSEGMVSYLNDTNKVEYYDGSAWEELTGDPDIFTQGTAGQYLQSNGTAGVDWAAIEDAAPRVTGLHYGRTGRQSSIPGVVTADSSYSVALGYNSSTLTNRPNEFRIGNTTIGANTGQSVTTGDNNVMVGGESGISLTTGAFNVFVGSSSGQAVTTGESNVYVGFGAGTLANGSGHVAIGAGALERVEISSGGASVAIGQGSMLNTTGDANVAIGSGSGTGITSGVNNTVVGFSAGNDFFANDIGTGSNNTLLGSGTSPSATNVSNEITLGNASIATLRCQVTTISALSDIRDKKNVEELPYGLNIIQALKPVSFDWNMRDGAKVDIPDFGFIAQDLAAVEDQHDAQRLALTLRNNPDRLEATPGRLIPILVKAIQELTARVEELENAK
jgi:hypothetical protein